MLRISLQTLRTRWPSLLGAFAAIWLAVTFAYAAGLLMTAALSAPGPGRFAEADLVLRGDPTVRLGEDSVDAATGQRLDSSMVKRVAREPGVARAVGDVSFPAGGRDGRGRSLAAGLRGRDWAAASLAPYELRTGRAPQGPREVVAATGLGLRVGSRVQLAAPAGGGGYRVSGIAAGEGPGSAVFFAPGVAAELAGAAGQVDAIGVVAARGTSVDGLRERLERRTGAEVLDRAHASQADPADARAAEREELVAIFGAMGGIAGVVALFVVAGTFALAVAQRRRETAVLRALGATPLQVRRLIAGEALLVSLVAGGLGVAAGAPIADQIVRMLGDHGVVPAGFGPVFSWIPLAAALGLGVGIAQLAVIAAAWRAGRTRPAEALREAAIEHPRPGVLRVLAGLFALGGGVAMALVFSGILAQSFAILGGMLLASGVGLLGRWVLGVPAALLARPARRLGAAGLLAGTGLAANRWRTAALASPIVLIAMLAGTQAVVQSSVQEDAERVTAARVTAPHVVRGLVPAGTAERVAALDGVDGVAAVQPTELFGLSGGLAGESPWTAAGLALHGQGADGTLDLGMVRGNLRDVRGSAVAVSRVVAEKGGLAVGDVLRARLADTAPVRLRVAAVYDRAAGLGHVVLDGALVRRHTAGRADTSLFVAGGGAALRREVAARPGAELLTRTQYLATLDAEGQEESWGVWMIIGLAAAFAALALVNTAAMASAERRDELATIRLLGGTSAQAVRAVVLELVPTVLVALAAGAAIVAVAVWGVPRGVDGVSLTVPVAAVGALVAGAALLGLLAAAVAARLALRAPAADVMRARE